MTTWKKDYISQLPAAGFGHMVKFWPMRCKMKYKLQFLASVFKVRRHVLSPYFILPVGRNLDYVVGAQVALLNHEVILGQKLCMAEPQGERNLGPNT